VPCLFFAPSPTKWWYSTGWWFATWILFSHILEIIIPTDFHIFQRETTNQNGDTTINEWLDGSDLQHLLRNPDGAIVGRFVYMLATTTKSWSKSRWKSHFFWLKHVHQSWYWTIKIIIFQSLKRQILIIFDANSNCNILDYSNRISADLLIPVLQKSYTAIVLQYKPFTWFDDKKPLKYHFVTVIRLLQ
jgi:hypothetical protein